MPPAHTDSWPSTVAADSPSAPTTPSKRASRSSRISNDTDYRSFTRSTSVGGTETTVEFRVGDTVVVGADAKLKQKFLAPPAWQVEVKGKGKGKKGKGKGKKRSQDEDDEDEEPEGWRHEDGLNVGDKVAVITRLFEDVRGRKMALVRWFARPGAVWGPDGPDEDDDAGDVLPYELYFTSDSTHLEESRVVRQRAAANPFSSPSGSPSKHSRMTGSTSAVPSPSRTNPSFVSSSAVFRTPQHSDPVPVSTILSHAEIFSPSSLPDTTITASQQSPIPTFLCRRVYDVKPIPGASFWGEIEWDEHRMKAVEWYESTMGMVERKEGGREREVAQDGWDVEAVLEESESESEDQQERERRRRRAEKARATRKRTEKTREERGAQHGAASESEASSDEEDEEGAFNDRDSASSDSDTGLEGDESDDGSASDLDRVSRTPTKRKPLHERQPSAASSSRKTAATRAKRTRPATSAATGRAAKRRKFASFGKSSSDASHNALPPLLESARLASFTPFERAKALLHVSATPESLPCREDQREQIRQFIGDAVLGRSGGCLYIHGVPGTGKTATVHSVVRELQNDEDMDAFSFVEINGMKISEPMTAFSHLWAALAPPDPQQSGRKVSPKAALAALENHFANPDPARKTTVVLVDELDQMLTKRQDVLYNFFNWPHVPHSRLVVLAVANTMDLPERELSGKIRSRLGTNRIPFQPYTWTELKRILEARLALVDPSSAKYKSTPLFDDVALQKIAKSVAGISGDARKALDVARRTLDRVALRLSKEGKALDELEQGDVKCSIQDASQAYKDVTRQGPAAFVRMLSTQMKVLLLAVAQCIRRAGVPEVELDTVLTWHLDFLRQTSLCPNPSSGPSKTELVALLSQLHALRLVTAESQRLDVFQRVRPAVDEGDLFAALREDEVLKAHVPKVL
ncbi:origin recognition complex subunit 1 [Rhodotorula toruloides]|uniref:Origin recognition complex subunit 1 n=1 Tax=Rhodotorula toruloides TaxID=5286 RepID=A0A511KGM4_RHOTO|nr:origin recognition complex subunit 1 [Rhodotorula toruloides]